MLGTERKICKGKEESNDEVTYGLGSEWGKLQYMQKSKKWKGICSRLMRKQKMRKAV